jgi:hypothetical protein
MRKFIILVLAFAAILTFEVKPQDDFWSRVEVGILGGPLFPSGDDVDYVNLSTGYYIGMDARYQLFRFMAVGISFGRNSWSSNVQYELFKTNQFESEQTDVTSGKTNVCLSLHFGPSAPTWQTVTGYREDISDVKPYQPGMIVPFFIFEIGPYFWNWTEGDFEESGSDVFIRGTLAGFYQASRLISITLGVNYTLYEFGTEFTAFGIMGGLRFNMGQIISGR